MIEQEKIAVQILEGRNGEEGHKRNCDFFMFLKMCPYLQNRIEPVSVFPRCLQTPKKVSVLTTSLLENGQVFQQLNRPLVLPIFSKHGKTGIHPSIPTPFSKMAESSSQSDSQSSKSISDDEQIPKNQPKTEYEKKRLERIKENKARMEALRLSTLASSLLNSPEKKKSRKNKKSGKNKEDEEYEPSDCEIRVSSCSENSEDDLDTSRDSSHKGKVKQSLKKCNQKKKPSAQKHVRKLDFMDDDEALQQAIALSLEDSLDISHGVFHERAQKRRTDASVIRTQENKGRAAAKEGIDKQKKTRKLNTSHRLQITEDQVIIHFFQFDEAGKGGITLKDLKRVAIDHDFNWSDDEMTNMIHFFDNDGDGKLNLEDFQKILHRCNMIKE